MREQGHCLTLMSNQINIVGHRMTSIQENFTISDLVHHSVHESQMYLIIIGCDQVCVNCPTRWVICVRCVIYCCMGMTWWHSQLRATLQNVQKKGIKGDRFHARPNKNIKHQHHRLHPVKKTIYHSIQAFIHRKSDWSHWRIINWPSCSLAVISTN